MPADKPQNPLSKIQVLLREKTKTKLSAPHFWKPAGLIFRITSKVAIHKWLKIPTSLTAKLKSLCPDLQVVVLSEKFEVPLVSESQKLGLPLDEKAWVRCVLLKCGERHWVYARTIIPYLTPQNPWYELQQLGDKPLGEVLFEMPSIERSAFEFSKDKIDAWPYLVKALQTPHVVNQFGFARRSIFKQQQAPLLLTEVFLPALLEQQDM